MEEIWKDVVGYEGLYQISNLGRVKRLSKISERTCTDTREGKHGQGVYNQVRTLPEKILKAIYGDKGYYSVGLTKDGKSKKHRIHRLVAIAFIPNPENKLEVNHKDGDKSNNCLTNLEWTTGEENLKHAIDTGLNNSTNRSKLSDEDRKWILENVIIGDRDYGVLAMARKYNTKANTIRKLIHKNS